MYCLEIRRSGKAWFSLTRGVPFSQPRLIPLVDCAGLVINNWLVYCTGSLSGFSDGQSPGSEVRSEHKRSKANNSTEREENPRSYRSQLTI